MLKVRIKFRKYGVMRFIGHLDVMRYFQKAIRRAEIPIAFTTGYSPHMIMSFAQPLGVGVTSDGEYFDIEITEPISSEKAVAQLNAVMVEGVEVISFREISSDKKASGMTIVAAADYKVTFPETFQHAEEIRTLPESWKEKVSSENLSTISVLLPVPEQPPRQRPGSGPRLEKCLLMNMWTGSSSSPPEGPVLVAVQRW